MQDETTTQRGPSRPPLPEPQRQRWQPLRMGLVDLFHYDSEEFGFHDGHLLLRGNNGTGKSKVLSLTLPLLFDAQLRSSRVEPDGDAGKKMAWNLLLGSYPRRIGYSWIEFGRRGHDGKAHYLTLGVGLSAVADRAQVDSWFFLLEGSSASPAPRIGQDLWLTSEQRVVLTRERLREAIAGHGQLFENAQSYRRAVDERLFHLGTRRYDALMDTLIQLRQPQLSKKPDETGLSNALSESLPPLPGELLADVAEALNQLEEDRIQLEETRRLEQAVTQFERRYRLYASMLARRQARELRQAQTGFDNASEARHRAQAQREQAQATEAAAIDARDQARQTWLAERERVEALQSDPANQDANRLTQAERDAEQRRQAALQAARQCDEAQLKLRREAELGRERARHTQDAEQALSTARTTMVDTADTLGSANEVAGNPLVKQAADAMADWPHTEQAAAAEHLRTLAARRRQAIRHVRQRHAEVTHRQTAAVMAQEAMQTSQADLDDALVQRQQADERAECEGRALAEACSVYCDNLIGLHFESSEALRQLDDWVARPEGENPLRTALAAVYQTALREQAAYHAQLDTQREAQRQQRVELEAEQRRLAAGEDALPPPPHTRAPEVRAERSGAPLWRLVDFHESLSAAERAGLEAALEASGLLDAWLAPDGQLTGQDGQVVFDSTWVQRKPVGGTSLRQVLVPVLPDGCPVQAQTIMALLAGVACGKNDDGAAEAWLSLDGRFRLGVLSGAWYKTEARHIGHTARERARQRRLEEIAALLAELDGAELALDRQYAALAQQSQQTEQEWQRMPSDQLLLKVIAEAASAGSDVQRAMLRLEQAHIRCRDAEALLQQARDLLLRDAADLQLPAEEGRLPVIEQALERFDDARNTLLLAVREWQRAWLAHVEQQQRQDEARVVLEQAQSAAETAQEEAAQAQARFEVLRGAVGQKVDALFRQLAQSKAAAAQAEEHYNHKMTACSEAAAQLAVADNEVRQKEETLTERSQLRSEAAECLHHFTQSGLLISALPDLSLPENWSIDPVLNLARRIEQALSQVSDDEHAWTRVQRQITSDLTELQSALSALGHQAVAEPNDWGFAVTIQYQNRSEQPGKLAALLAADIAQRSELLSAREREILENHLQAEIAAEIQRLMRAADERVNAINEELHKRPTTTGVRYRLQWEPLSTDEGAPAGLEAARKHLLNTSADLWSAADRRTVGTMLQQQIAAERARAEADITGSSLLDQLVRALDYRHWHRFRIQRQQDGQWRKLSGPASSGERALGLTVPLFAAIASFYGHDGSPLAPRLMLLDEAFAGIDDTARAHCMGLIREFDLDFVITSEREWACYAELPGVAICQLQRREGIDAVFVSRWTWDGRAKRVEDDPDRRFPPSA